MIGAMRRQDILFAILAVAVIALMAVHVYVVVLALVGAFLCGSGYLLLGMLPEATESFGSRAFTTVFLAVVLSSLVLILPATFGAVAKRTDVQNATLAVAGLLPLGAICFEVLRTPRVIRAILWCLGYR
jgi:uncharacterized membrane protein